jgi:hypothetical protein
MRLNPDKLHPGIVIKYEILESADSKLYTDVIVSIDKEDSIYMINLISKNRISIHELFTNKGLVMYVHIRTGGIHPLSYLLADNMEFNSKEWYEITE